MFKKLARSICFLLLLGAVTLTVFNILRWKNSGGIVKFYKYPAHTVDAAFLGSSHCYCTVNTALLWEKYGMAAVNMGDSGQNIGTTYYYIKELLKTQSPSVIAVELNYAAHEADGLDNGNMYRNTLNMKWSRNYTDNLSYSLRLAENKIDYADYFKYLLLKFPVFHSRYSELTDSDFSGYGEDARVGRYRGSWVTGKALETPAACSVTETADDLDTQWLDKITALAAENNVSLVFFVAPYIISSSEMRTFNSIKNYAAEKNIPYFNFNEIYEEIGLDYSQDLRERSHLNNYGAEKVTSYLGDYINQTFSLPDRRGEKGYTLYDKVWENWEKDVYFHELTEETELGSYLDILKQAGASYAILRYDQSEENIRLMDSILQEHISTEAADSLLAREYYSSTGYVHGVSYLSDSVVLHNRSLYLNASIKVPGPTDTLSLWVISTDPRDGSLAEIGKFARDGETFIKAAAEHGNTSVVDN